MAPPPFMQMYWSDYFGDTRHLTCEQHGAYLQLIGSMWLSDGSLPNDAKKLAKITGCTASRWAKIAEDVMAFFVVEGDRITHKRIGFELEKAREKSIKRAEAGSRGGAAKALKNNESELAIATALPQHLPEPDTRDTTEPKGSSVSRGAQAPAPKPEKTGSRLPDGWSPDDDDWAMAMEALGGDIPAVNELDKFRDYWRAVPGAKGRKLEWDSTWRNWIRRAVENRPAHRKAHEPNHHPQPDRNDKLRAMLAGAMAASDDAKHGL